MQGQVQAASAKSEPPSQSDAHERANAGQASGRRVGLGGLPATGGTWAIALALAPCLLRFQAATKSRHC